MNQSSPTRRSTMLFGWLVIAVILALLAEGAAYFYLNSIINQRKGYMFEMDVEQDIAAIDDFSLQGFATGTWPYRPDPQIGWVRNTGVDHVYANGLSSSTYANGARRIPGVSADNALIAIYGDSFTEAVEVSDENTWSAVIARELDVGVLNFGVSAYGPDQALLRLQANLDSGIDSTPVVVIAMIPENINRIVNLYRAFYVYPGSDFSPAFKPTLVPDAGGYRLVNPVPEKLTDRAVLLTAAEQAMEYDEWYKLRTIPFSFPYSWDAARVVLKFGITPDLTPAPIREAAKPRLAEWMRRFAALAEQHGFQPVWILLPGFPNEVTAWREEKSHWLSDFIARELPPGVLFIDALAALAKEDFDIQRMTGIVHYSDYANDHVGQLIAQRLRPVVEKARQQAEQKRPPAQESLPVEQLPETGVMSSSSEQRPH